MHAVSKDVHSQEVNGRFLCSRRRQGKHFNTHVCTLAKKESSNRQFEVFVALAQVAPFPFTSRLQECSHFACVAETRDIRRGPYRTRPTLTQHTPKEESNRPSSNTALPQQTELEQLIPTTTHRTQFRPTKTTPQQGDADRDAKQQTKGQERENQQHPVQLWRTAVNHPNPKEAQPDQVHDRQAR